MDVCAVGAWLVRCMRLGVLVNKKLYQYSIVKGDRVSHPRTPTTRKSEAHSYIYFLYSLPLEEFFFAAHTERRMASVCCAAVSCSPSSASCAPSAASCAGMWASCGKTPSVCSPTARCASIVGRKRCLSSYEMNSSTPCAWLGAECVAAQSADCEEGWEAGKKK